MLGYISFSRLFLDFPRQPHDSWAFFPLSLKNHTPQWLKWELRFLNQLKSDGWMCNIWSNKCTHTNTSMKNTQRFVLIKHEVVEKQKINRFQSDSVKSKREIYPCLAHFYWTVTKRPSVNALPDMFKTWSGTDDQWRYVYVAECKWMCKPNKIRIKSIKTCDVYAHVHKH